MTTLKNQILGDIDKVFLNTDEFANDCVIEIGGIKYEAKIVRDDDTLLERNDAAAQGTYLGEKLIFIKASVLPGRPSIDARITLDGEPWLVANCIENMGMYEIRIGANRNGR